jgi:thiol-disulfide isomerase/thioredoxin
MVDVKVVAHLTRRRGVPGTVALLAAWGFILGAAPEQPMSEAQLRREMGFTADQRIVYLAPDGSAMSYADFGKRAQAGGTFDVGKASDGSILLRLKTPAVPVASSQPLPEFLPALQLTTITGQPVRGTDFEERPLLLSFFFSACAPCIKEVPILNAFAAKHREFHYLAVTFDSKDEAARFVQQHNLKWPVVAGAHEFISLAGVVAYPAYLLVSRQGKIMARGTGLDTRAAVDPQVGLKVFEQWVADSQSGELSRH